MDPHAHLWERFDVGRFLDGVNANLSRFGAPGTRFSALLVLADASGQEGLRRLRRLAAGGGDAGRRVGPWRVRSADPGGAVTLSTAGEDAAPGKDAAAPGSSHAGDTGPAGPDRLFVVPGRQIRTASGVEVLSLGARPDVPDGLPVSEAVERVAASGARAVVPWGFGKWWGGRGRAVRRLLGEWSSPRLFLGDIAGRPRAWPEPSLFREARSAGVRVLPGSDPLPIRGGERRAARYGFVLPGRPDPERPAAWLGDALDALAADPPSFGRRVRLPAFVRDQVLLRVGR